MPEKILLVDDEKEFVDALAERMRARDMDVTAVTTAKDALSKADEETYDAIILDLQMPEMDGIEALKRIKEKNPDMQIILLTGHATVEKSVTAMKLGAMDLLEKPTDIETLTEKIKEAHHQRMLLVEKETEQKIQEIIGVKGW
jgi:two-component system OmpR family response regulator